MANISKAEREKRTAESQDKETEMANEAGLVRMVKDGDVIDVHPTCAADHERLGWKAQ